jgi:hypothetical protein
MTPKEKAKELVFMFSNEVRGIFFKKFRTKQCALIAVDEIINSMIVATFNKHPHLPYWQQVKKEIEKL